MEVRVVRLELPEPFRAPFGTVSEREVVIVGVETAEYGWSYGECASLQAPVYSPDYTSSSVDVLVSHFIPALAAEGALSADEAAQVLIRFRGYEMAKAALLDACLIRDAAIQNVSLRDLVGGQAEQIECGISLGMRSDTADLLEDVESALEEGYRRIKLKVSPSWFHVPLTAIRDRFPDIPLTVDCNGSFSTKDHHRLLCEADEYRLLYLEQPFDGDQLVAHARLQYDMATPICLDESIVTPGDLEVALELNACQVVNLKVGRVGGLRRVVELHDMCEAAGVPVWCGGLMETAVGQSICLVAASLPNFKYPADIGPSDRYFVSDIDEIGPMDGGLIKVPKWVGQPCLVDPDILERVTTYRTELAV